MINIQKLVTHVTRCLSGVYVWYTAAQGSFKAPCQPGARPVKPYTGISLRALRKKEGWSTVSSHMFILQLYHISDPVHTNYQTFV